VRSGLPGALALLLLAASCGPFLQQPRDVRPEADVCPECRMTVLPDGSAAEMVDAEGMVMVFDDPGCLVFYKKDKPRHFEGGKVWVQDRTTKAWVDWDTAVWVKAPDVPTAMNYGWHAFADQAGAEAFAAAHAGARVAGVLTTEQMAADLEPVRWKP